MTAKEKTEVDRLAALVERKFAAMEEAEKPPTLAELNAVRRLIDWINRERQLERAKKLTTVR